MISPIPSRSSGILLHPTCLPGPFGIGDIGPTAKRWVQTLAAMKQSWWQILPLGPTGLGDSPYMSFSAFAGNIALLSPEWMVEKGLIPDSALQGLAFNYNHVEFNKVLAFKRGLVRAAHDSFRHSKAPALWKAFQDYCEQEKDWLHDYALFMAIRSALGDRARQDFPVEVLQREPIALAALERELNGEITRHKLGQFLFDTQWAELRAFAKENGVGIIGDIPIFVAGDSADVWANPTQFLLNKEGKQTVQAGVPPDYFSEDGQLWGNPIYHWAAMKVDGYRWWIARVKRALQQVDLIRLDHFRGFAQAWHVPVEDKTAKGGTWVDGPGLDLFQAIEKAVGRLPFIAEDLGLITPDVHKLRTTLNLPGMRVLQFAIGDAANPYQPHNYEPETVVYTGTHDNDTTAGWYAKLNNNDRHFWFEYLGKHVEDPSREFLRVAWSSTAKLAIAPLQDLLGLGSEARVNTPGLAEGNWGWRVRPEQFPQGILDHMKHLTARYGRIPRE